MGIKICPQCNGKVSDTRNDCPHCNYIFPKLKKCPDCEEEIDGSLSECPICGRTFEKETSKEVSSTIQAPQNNQEPQHNDGPNCPYCDSTESMEIGNGLHLCATCKNKFLDTRGLPTPPPFTPKSVIESTMVGITAPDNTTKYTKENKFSKVRLINKCVLAIAIICWVVGLFFMGAVRGESGDYYSLMHLFTVDVLSCLTVIFVYIFGAFLLIEFIVNFKNIKKYISVIVSVITLLVGAAAVSITSCLECGDYCFFCHRYGGFLITLIALLGTSVLCQIISLILTCVSKPR